MYKFRVIEDVGRIYYVCAKTRKKAIEVYCNEKGCNEEYVKKTLQNRKLGEIFEK